MAWNPAGSNLLLRRARRRPGGDGAMLLPAPAGPSSLGTLDEFLADQLTQLGGHLSLRRHLESVLDRFQPFGTRPALLLIDIDRFNRLNTTYGREVGDQILVAVAGRLRRLIPGEDATFRTGGDEFVALLDSMEMIDGVGAAQRIQVELSQPVAVGTSIIPMTVSVAVVMLGHRHRVDELLRDADVTMYRAKTEGGNRADLYNWEIDSWSTARKKQTERLQKEVEDLRRKNRILSEALTTDLVTSMPNALAFDSDLLQADAWRRRSGEPYSVLRACVDGIYEAALEFRSDAAADAITAISHAVRDTVRTSDRAYVLDRGELVVLLRGSTLKQAVLASDRVRTAVRKLALVHPADTTRTMSVSVAAIEAGYRHSGPQDVMKELNDLLEKAVTQGGDRVLWPI